MQIVPLSKGVALLNICIGRAPDMVGNGKKELLE